MQLVSIITYLDHFIVEMERWTRHATGHPEGLGELKPNMVARLKEADVVKELKAMRAATHLSLSVLVQLMLRLKTGQEDVEPEAVVRALKAMDMPSKA